MAYNRAKADWDRAQELHVVSQRHAEWAAKRVLRIAEVLKTVMPDEKVVTQIMTLMPSFEKGYRVKGEHLQYMRELVNSQLQKLYGREMGGKDGNTGSEQAEV